MPQPGQGGCIPAACTAVSTARNDRAWQPHQRPLRPGRPPRDPATSSGAGAGDAAGPSGSGAGAAPAAATPPTAGGQPWDGVDEGAPTTSIQLRLADGSRMVRGPCAARSRRGLLQADPRSPAVTCRACGWLAISGSGSGHCNMVGATKQILSCMWCSAAEPAHALMARHYLHALHAWPRPQVLVICWTSVGQRRLPLC